MNLQITSTYIPVASVASFTKKVNSQLAKRPLKTDGRLANRELTSLVKEATGIKLTHFHWKQHTTNILYPKTLSHGSCFVVYCCVMLWYGSNQWYLDLVDKPHESLITTWGKSHPFWGRGGTHSDNIWVNMQRNSAMFCNQKCYFKRQHSFPVHRLT